MKGTSVSALIGLLAVLTAIGVPAARFARGVELFPTPGVALTLALLFSAGVFLLLLSLAEVFLLVEDSPQRDSPRRSQKN